MFTRYILICRRKAIPVKLTRVAKCLSATVSDPHPTNQLLYKPCLGCCFEKSLALRRLLNRSGLARAFGLHEVFVAIIVVVVIRIVFDVLTLLTAAHDEAPDARRLLGQNARDKVEKE